MGKRLFTFALNGHSHPRQSQLLEDLIHPFPEAAGPVIKDVLGPLLATQGVRGSALRQHIGVTADASLKDFIDAARRHPVFELGSAHKTS